MSKLTDPNTPPEAAPPSREDALVDRFGRRHTYLRVSLTERCNLRCTYCMPADGIPLKASRQYLQRDEVLRLVELFVSAGVDKIRWTGGEPLVRKDAVEIIRDAGQVAGVAGMAITTNGLLLTDRLEALYEAGVRAFNLSLDTLDARRFPLIARRQGFDEVLRALDALVALHERDPEVSVKLNCVVMRGVNDDELPAFVELTRERPIEVRFIEHMPFDGNAWRRDSLVSMREMLDLITAHTGALETLPGHPSDTARAWRAPGHRGTVGVIASMTAPFCAGCNRVRLTADGALKVCLFGNREVSLRDAMRRGASDDELCALVHTAVLGKHAAHAGVDVLADLENRPMITIGG